jgi:cytochrome c-type biogenesis protein CcmH
MTRPARARLAAILATVLAVAATAVALTATAPAAEPKTDLKTIEEQVMCVVCRTPLSVAGGPQAAAQRRLINRLIAQGRSEQEIKDALVVEYGERVLALPDDDGFNLAVYLVPVVVVLGALLALALALPRWRRRARADAAAHPAPAAGPELSAEDVRRLDEDLRRYDG